MRRRRIAVYVMLTLLSGGILSQLPSAMGATTANPLSAIWDAIFDLQNQNKDLQAQIDQLKAERENISTVQSDVQAYTSDAYTKIDAVTSNDGNTQIKIAVGNNGPDRAAGTKLTVFYLMPLFEINSITGSDCQDLSRGIITCTIGTLESRAVSNITINAIARESGKANTWTADLSATTDDSNPQNNHVSYSFETGSGTPVAIVDEVPIEQAIEQVQQPQTNLLQGNSSSAASSENQTSQQVEQLSNSTDGTSNSTNAATGNSTSDSQETTNKPQDQPVDGSSDSGSQQSSSNEQDSNQSSGENSNETNSGSNSTDGSSSDPTGGVNSGNSTQTVSQ